MVLNLVVSVFGRLVARSGRKRGNRQTDGQYITPMSTLIVTFESKEVIDAAIINTRRFNINLSAPIKVLVSTSGAPQHPCVSTPGVLILGGCMSTPKGAGQHPFF